MFQFNFNNRKEELVKDADINEKEEIKWHDSCEMKAPQNIQEIVSNLGKEEVMELTFGRNLINLFCLTPSKVINQLKNNSDGNVLYNMLEASDGNRCDLVTGQYEGGLKIWECTQDLANFLISNNHEFFNKKVLDLGCGYGILGMIALKLGAHVTFQDYNKEVLELVTIPNVFLNGKEFGKKVEFYSGDWASFFKLKLHRIKDDEERKYDVILSSETIYNPDNYSKICEIMDKLLNKNGVAFIAAKSYYFGVGGSVRKFEKFLEQNCLLKGRTCWSNSRENRKDFDRIGGNHVRPRSLYTAHSYHGEMDESNYTRYNDLSKYLEHSSSDRWNSGSRRRQLRSACSKPAVVAPFLSPEDAPPTIYAEKWREVTDATELSPGAAIATPTGIMSLRLHDGLRVDVTIDKAIRVINVKNNIVLALSGSGSAAALMHPNGRVYQYGSRVEIVAHDINHGNNKYAKMWYKGVSFTSEQCALVYLVDTAGTRTTTDTFTDMTQDFSLSVFYAESRYGSQYIDDAIGMLEAAQYWVTDEGIENWIVNNVRISQAPDGLLRIVRNSNKYQIRTSPSNGTASLTTPFVHCTASLGQTSHLFVRRGERRMHYDGASFIVRNAGHSAGFDDKNQLKVY